MRPRGRRRPWRPRRGAAAVTADQIVEKYVAALGGADAIKKVTSRVMKGTIQTGGSETPIELFTKAPNKRISISNGQSYTAFDGTGGLDGQHRAAGARDVGHRVGGRGARRRVLPGAALEGDFPATAPRPSGDDRRSGVRDAERDAGPGRPPVRLYFDKNSGLLVRMVRYADTPVGRNATQIDYADYREMDGVKSPFRWTLSRPNGRFTIQVKEAKNNVPIEDAKFAKPEGDVK